MDDHPEDDDRGLDPADWPAFRARAHGLLDAALDKMQTVRDGPVWQAPPEALKDAFDQPLPRAGWGGEAVAGKMRDLFPYGVGNTHPRFFGWVHGAGTPTSLLAEIAAAAMNANLGGRDHGAIHVERQVVSWCRELMGFPAGASGLIVSGTSLATVIALKAARDRALGAATSRARGLKGVALTGYTSERTHACVARAFDILGLGAEALRKLPVDGDYRLDLVALRAAIAADRAAGHQPFALIGTAGSVDLGVIDPLDDLADIAASEGLWYHIDGAFGALGMLSGRLRPRLAGLPRADSLAFDFHKWMQVNYDAGLVLIRSEEAHRAAFAERPDYLKGAERGLAAGNPWPVDYGPELSRGFRALKVWAQFAEHGVDRLARVIDRNVEQAAWLGAQIAADPLLELLVPVTLNICCFRYVALGQGGAALDALNDEIVVRLQEAGTAAPSTTRIGGALAIRVNLTNHRTRISDLHMLLDEVRRIGQALT